MSKKRMSYPWYHIGVRIVQVAYKSDVTGGELVLLQLVQALVSSGHDVHVVCPTPGPLEDRVSALGGVPVIVPMPSTHSLSALFRLTSLFRHLKPDLIHTHGMLVNILGRLAAHRMQIPCISTVHVTRRLMGRPRVKGLLTLVKNRLYYRLLDNWTAKLARRTIAVSEAVRRDLIDQGQPMDTISVIPNGIDPEPFEAAAATNHKMLRQQLPFAEDAIIVGQVARLSPQKDLTTFVQAMNIASEKDSRLRGVIIGDGPERPKIEELIRHSNLSDRLVLLGFRNEVPALMADFDVFALSSRWEGLPLTILEAMATSLPVVATSVDGTIEAVVPDETGVLVPPEDAQAMANALLQLARDPERARAMGTAGHERVVEVFHVDRVTQAHLNLYEEAL